MNYEEEFKANLLALFIVMSGCLVVEVWGQVENSLFMGFIAVWFWLALSLFRTFFQISRRSS